MVENWNSAHGCIHFGNHGDATTNGYDDQETVVLCSVPRRWGKCEVRSFVLNEFTINLGP